MVAEKDIERVREALAGTAYEFSDDRFNNQKRLAEGVGHTQGEHEVIANHKDNEFHLGFFLFRREPDQSITIREYFMQESENGERIPMVLERHMPKELVDLEYTSEETEFAGTRFRTSTPESVYAKKMHIRHAKDMLDIEVLKDKVDERKIAEAKHYTTTLTVVKAVPDRVITGIDSRTTEGCGFTSTLRSEVKTPEDMAAEIVADNDNEVKSKVVEAIDRSEI